MDYNEKGNVGGIYGEGIGGFYQVFKDYAQHYRRGEWNRLLIRCEGNSPHIQVWMNGEKGLDWTGEDPDLCPPQGMIAVQVHGGQRWPQGKKTRFRNIRIREIQK